MGTMGRSAEVGSSKDAIFREIEEMFGVVPEWIRQLPEPALAGYWAAEKYYLGETVIPNKYKELIGVAVSGATRCRYCALFHTEGARLHGATDEEIAEASAVAGVTMLASTFVNAKQIDYDQFKAETLSIIDHVKKERAKGEAAKPGGGQKVERQARPGA